MRTIPGPCAVFLLVGPLAPLIGPYSTCLSVVFFAVYPTPPSASCAYMQFCGNNVPMLNVNFTPLTPLILHPSYQFPSSGPSQDEVPYVCT